MATEHFIFHPGSGQNRPTDGALLTKQDGTNFSWLEQQFPPAVDRTSFFHGIIAPIDLAVAGNVIFKAVFRQLVAGVGNLYVDIGFRSYSLAPPPNRDSVPLTSLSAPNPGTAVAVPGNAGDEFAIQFITPVASFTAGDEVLVFATRAADPIHAGDTFAGIAALVRLDVMFPLATAGCEWSQLGAPPGYLVPAGGVNQQVVVGSAAAPAVGVQVNIENGHLQIGDGLWNGQHLVMGYAPNDYHLWISPLEGTFGVLRIKKGSPGSATDGEIVGTQN